MSANGEWAIGKIFIGKNTFNDVNMPKYAYILESSFWAPQNTNPDTIELNDFLHTLQQKGAEIVDIKVSTIYKEELNMIRTYLIVYEAEKPLL